MSISFNPIAFESSIACDGHVQVAGTVVGRTLHNAVQCPTCGAAYNLLVPATASMVEVELYRSGLRATLSESCGMHPPFVQMQ
jgi:transcription elongation factor Elf1